MIFTVIGSAVGELFTCVRQYFLSKLLRQEEKKERNIEWHFNTLVSDVVEPVKSVVGKLGIQNGQIVLEWRISVNTTKYMAFPKSFDFERNEPFESFKTHYSERQETWHKLKEAAIEQNEKTIGFQREIETALKSCANLPVNNANTKEEMIIDHTPGILCQALYQLAQGQTPNYDFNNAKIEPIDSLYVVKFGVVVGTSHLIYTNTIEKAESCKSVLVRIQESKGFRQKAFEIIRDAEQIKSEFINLEKELNAVKLYGLRSKDPKYKFEPVKNCPICTKMFYKSKQRRRRE